MAGSGLRGDRLWPSFVQNAEGNRDNDVVFVVNDDFIDEFCED